MPTSKMPDLTPAQLVAAISAIATELVNAQWVSGHTEHLIVGLAGIIVPAAWMIADAIIRHGRSRALTPPAHTPTPPAA